VAETIEYEELQPGPVAGVVGESDLSRLREIPMELSVELGRSHMTVGETLELRVGAVVALERQAGEPADLLVNGSPIARGEIVVIDEQYGLRITEILDEPRDEGPAPDGLQADAGSVPQPATGQPSAGTIPGEVAPADDARD
jgi:flagellar motor switch protein FliN/FliY